MKLMNPFGFTEKIYVQFCNKTAVSGAQLFRHEKVDTYSPCDLFRSANSERSVHLPDMYSERPCPHGPVMSAGSRQVPANQETARRRRLGIRERLDRFN